MTGGEKEAMEHSLHQSNNNMKIESEPLYWIHNTVPEKELGLSCAVQILKHGISVPGLGETRITVTANVLHWGLFSKYIC